MENQILFHFQNEFYNHQPIYRIDTKWNVYPLDKCRTLISKINEIRKRKNTISQNRKKKLHFYPNLAMNSEQISIRFYAECSNINQILFKAPGLSGNRNKTRFQRQFIVYHNNSSLQQKRCFADQREKER